MNKQTIQKINRKGKKFCIWYQVLCLDREISILSISKYNTKDINNIFKIRKYLEKNLKLYGENKKKFYVKKVLTRYEDMREIEILKRYYAIDSIDNISKENLDYVFYRDIESEGLN